MGDVNGDGQPDVVVASNNAVQVLLSLGHGVFASPVGYPAQSPSKPLLVDLNGDGKLDIVTPGQSGVNILLNAGDGTFGAAATYERIGNIAVGDIDNNGSPDIISNGNVLLNDGNGKFVSTGQGYGSAASSLAIADLDGDGRNDVVFLTSDGMSYGITPSVGKGSLTRLPTTANLLVTGDVNGDGKPDLIFGSTDITLSGVFVALNSGNGTFGGYSRFDLKQAPNERIHLVAIGVGDLNCDGAADLAVLIKPDPSISSSVPSNEPDVRVLLNDGRGKFGTAIPYSVPEFSSSVSIADIDGDGAPDLITGATIFILGMGTSSTPPNTSVLINQGNGTFLAPISLASGMPLSPLAGVLGMAIADLNGDGKPDIIDVTDTNQVEIMINDGKGSFAIPSRIVPGGSLGGVALADMNGDGQVDLVTAPDWAFAGNVQLLLNKGNGIFAAPISILPTTSDTSSPDVRIVDINGDGKLDVVNGAEVLFGHGDGTFTPSPTTLRCRYISVVDFNADGKPDLLCDYGSIWINKGDGSFVLAISPPFGDIDRVFAGDVNGDGKPDLITARQDINSGLPLVDVALNQGNMIFGTAVEYHINSFDARSSVLFGLTLGDINGDGQPDLIISNASNTIAVMLNKGMGAFAPDMSYVIGKTLFGGGSSVSGTVPLTMVADLNGDGKLDVVATSAETARLLFNNGCL